MVNVVTRRGAILLCALTLFSPLALSACGSESTVDSSTETSPSIGTELPRDDGQSRELPPLTVTPAPVVAAAAPTRTVEEQSAREISDIPDAGPDLSEKDKGYLADLKGVNTDGVEDQLIGMAYDLCAIPDSPTVQAVAGQLIAQNRTTLGNDEVVTLLTNAAKSTYCS